MRLRRKRLEGQSGVIRPDRPVEVLSDDGVVIATIFIHKDELKIASSNIESVEMSNGRDRIPKGPIVIIKFNP